MRIYKYNVPVQDEFIIEMPENAQILSFQEQQGNLALWCAVYHRNPLEKRIFAIRGAGHDIDMSYVKKYIGTTQQLEGNLVWHLFEMEDVNK